jgi:hypothetical protein
LEPVDLEQRPQTFPIDSKPRDVRPERPRTHPPRAERRPTNLEQRLLSKMSCPPSPADKKTFVPENRPDTHSPSLKNRKSSGEKRPKNRQTRWPKLLVIEQQTYIYIS